MATSSRVLDIERTATVGTRQAPTDEVRRGLIGRPRSLSPWMFYDAEGSRLFERITALPEYYPTRTERHILAKHADAIAAAAHGDRTVPLRLVELGAGTAAKTVILLEAALRTSEDVSYMPVDVSADALGLACQNIACELPAISESP
jgi:L-histidine Nalpha-methyltransferase